jgi:hypothetical protein
MHADFGLEPAVSIFAFDTECGALDAGDIARGNLEQFGFPAAMLAPAQIHAQQHFGPILRFGSAGARLHIDESIMRIHLARKHTLEFELVHLNRKRIDVDRYGADSIFICLRSGKFEQLFGAIQAVGETADAVDDLVERSALFTELLGVFGVVPDRRTFKLARDFFEAL